MYVYLSSRLNTQESADGDHDNDDRDGDDHDDEGDGGGGGNDDHDDGRSLSCVDLLKLELNPPRQATISDESVPFTSCSAVDRARLNREAFRR